MVPSGLGLNVPELHAYARKALSNGNTPVAITVVDEVPMTAAGIVNAAALPVPELSGLLPYQAPATATLDVRNSMADLFKAPRPVTGQLGQMADARK